MASMKEKEKGPDPSLATRLGPLELRTPVIAASGTYGYGIEFDNLSDFDYFGAITLKAVSIEPRKGNPYPRIVETPSGMLNTIGLENPGVEVFINEKLPEAAKLGVPLIANLVGDQIDDYRKLAEILDSEDSLAALEINGSCPNVERGYTAFAADAGTCSELMGAVREVTSKPIIAKLSPNVGDIVPIAEAAYAAGANILNLGNTYLGMSISIDDRRSRISRDYGGLSGRAIRPLALRIVHQVASSIDIPLIGSGGIYDTGDAIEFLIAGASVVSLGTVNFIQPNMARTISEGISEYLSEKKMALADFIGSYQGPSACADSGNHLT